MSRTTILKQWVQIAFGLFVFSFGVHLEIFADIGLAPWDCLAMGMSYHTPFNYGTCVTMISVLILIIDILMKERIGFGTVLDAFLCGPYIQFFNDHNPLPKEHSTLAGVFIMLLGFIFIAIGMWIYMSGCQCCGPRDALLVGLGKCIPKVPIGAVQIFILLLVLGGGYLLGGPIGIGTVIATFGIGFAMQIIYSIIKFEPRDLVHKDVVEITRSFLNKN